jgi:hypothetical protein
MFLLLLGLACVFPGNGNTQSTNPSKATQTLIDSNAISKNLRSQDSTRDRISYLVRLTRASVDIAPPQLTEAWCEELFTLASRSPLGWDRVANQKNAAIPLATIDPKRAMELLAKTDRPQPHTMDGKFSEDVRDTAAAAVFPKFVHDHDRIGLTQLQAVSQVRRQAQEIGDTGEYPYQAMAYVIRELMASKADGANEQSSAIFQDGFAYFKRHSQFQDEEDEFLDLLESAENIAPASTYKEALELYVSRVLVPSTDGGVFSARVKTSKGTVVRLDNQNKELLWRVSPLVNSYDHERFQTLQQKNPELIDAQGGSVERVGSAFIPGTPSREYAEQKSSQLMEITPLSKIKLLIKNDKDNTGLAQAIEIAKSLNSLPARIIGYSYILPDLLKSDSKSAAQMYSAESEDFKKISDPLDQLKAKVAIAESAYYFHDLDKFNKLTSEVLVTGTQLFEKDSRHSWADLRNGYSEMGNIVEFSANHNVPAGLEGLGLVENPLLKAHLMIFEAKGLHETEQNSRIAAR